MNAEKPTQNRPNNRARKKGKGKREKPIEWILPLILGSIRPHNLTPDQLAKKRANDREAQRAIRERTKGQIEGLERKIQELTSQQPYQEVSI